MDEPVRMLWAAVFRQAVDDALSLRSGVSRRLAAEEWFRSRARHVGSFLWTADLLRIDACRVRRSLEEHRSRFEQPGVAVGSEPFRLAG